MRKPAKLLTLLALLTAAASMSLLPPVSVEQQEKNRIQWMALSEFDRERFRAEWADLNAEPLDGQLVVMRRLATLERLRARPALSGDGTRGPEEIERTLEGVAFRLRRLLDVEEGRSDVEASQKLRASTKHRIDAFLDNLVDAERLSPVQRDELRRASWDEFVRLALEIQKTEEIYLYSELSSRGERTQLESLAPLDVIDEMLEIRRLRGFLGQAGVVLGLSAEEQQMLAAAPDDDFFRIAKRLMEPKARAYMSTHLEMDSKQIDRVLARPYRDLERSLHLLVQGKL
jgi:hypothetical protein